MCFPHFGAPDRSWSLYGARNANKFTSSTSGRWLSQLSCRLMFLANCIDMSQPCCAGLLRSACSKPRRDSVARCQGTSSPAGSARPEFSGALFSQDRVPLKLATVPYQHVCQTAASEHVSEQLSLLACIHPDFAIEILDRRTPMVLFFQAAILDADNTWTSCSRLGATKAMWKLLAGSLWPWPWPLQRLRQPWSLPALRNPSYASVYWRTSRTLSFRLKLLSVLHAWSSHICPLPIHPAVQRSRLDPIWHRFFPFAASSSDLRQ